MAFNASQFRRPCKQWIEPLGEPALEHYHYCRSMAERTLFSRAVVSLNRQVLLTQLAVFDHFFGSAIKNDLAHVQDERTV